MDTRTAVYVTVFCLYMSYLDSRAETTSTGTTSNSTKSTERYELPPPEFPDDSTKYRIVPSDESLLRILSEDGDKHTKASEIYDLLHSSQYVEPSPLSPFNDSKKNATSAEYVNFKLQSELLQEDRGYVARDDFQRHLTEHAGHSHSIGGKVGFLSGTVAAVVIGTLVLVVIVFYLGMVLWRRKLRSKYAHREALQNDDDFILDDDRSLEVI